MYRKCAGLAVCAMPGIVFLVFLLNFLELHGLGT